MTRRPSAAQARAARAVRFVVAGLLPLSGWISAPALVGLAEVQGGSAELSPAERRGRTIYRTGISQSGHEVVALIGPDALEAPGAAMPCVNCHGGDGRGRPEGGVTPTDLTWPHLTKPYGLRHASGRSHPPYDESRLKRAISMGLDPAGNELHMAMPRYRLSLSDMADLMAYLKRLGDEPQPGIYDNVVRIGTLLPREGPLGAQGRAIEAALRANLEETNAQGGVFGRRLELVVADLSGDQAVRTASLRDLTESEEVFALAGIVLAGAEERSKSILLDSAMPIVGPFTRHPLDSFPLPPRVFYLHSGIQGELLGLARSIEERLGRHPRAALVRRGFRSEAELLAERVREMGWTDLIPADLGDGDSVQHTLNEIKGQGIEALFILAPPSLADALLREADAIGFHPLVCLPGSLAGKEILSAPSGFQGRLFLAYPFLPQDWTASAQSRYRRLAERHELPRQNRNAQILAIAASDVLVEGLRRSGRDLTRERFVRALESLKALRTGWMPAISYDPNRRVGNRGVHIVQVGDVRGTNSLSSRWIDLP